MKTNSLARGFSGTGRFVFAACVGIALAATPGAAYAQAAASYGMAAGSSAATTAKAASSINRATNKLAGRIAGSVSQSGAKYASRSLSKPYEEVMEENRKKLEDASKDGGATLHIESTPAKATVLIDGEPVAKTPADLKVPEGSHTVELKEFESVDWKKEITVARDENLTLQPELKKRYQSAITVSFK
jgi:hypothetical protein